MLSTYAAQNLHTFGHMVDRCVLPWPARRCQRCPCTPHRTCRPLGTWSIVHRNAAQGPPGLSSSQSPALGSPRFRRRGHRRSFSILWSPQKLVERAEHIQHGEVPRFTQRSTMDSTPAAWSSPPPARSMAWAALSVRGHATPIILGANRALLRPNRPPELLGKLHVQQSLPQNVVVRLQQSSTPLRLLIFSAPSVGPTPPISPPASPAPDYKLSVSTKHWSHRDNFHLLRRDSTTLLTFPFSMSPLSTLGRCSAACRLCPQGRQLGVSNPKSTTMLLHVTAMNSLPSLLTRTR